MLNIFKLKNTVRYKNEKVHNLFKKLTLALKKIFYYKDYKERGPLSRIRLMLTINKKEKL
jgi:hypothetical protein